MFRESVYINVSYKYNGRDFNDLEISQNIDELRDNIVILKNDDEEVMFKAKDFDELSQFVKDLKAGKYANGKEE